MKKAFTLAEVLITLGIIGIVAAMTLPTLVQKNNEKVTITKLKKIYSSLNQSFKMATLDGSTPQDWLTGQTPHTKEAGEEIAKRLKQHLKIASDCSKMSDNSSCWPKDIKLLKNSEHWTAGVGTGLQSSTFSTADGYFIDIDVYSSDCSTVSTWRGNKGGYICAHVWVDTNGNTKPNTLGRDIFLFYISNKGIEPSGTMFEVDNRNPFYKSCINSWGAGCTAWVLYNENMDYLHCNDLSWDGKKKCK